MILSNMKRLFITSTIGQKMTLGITGLALSLFVGGHMAANLLLFSSPKIYNFYSNTLITNPLIEVFEIFLLISFVIHAAGALLRTYFNKKAKGEVGFKDPSSSLIHKTLWMQGGVIVVFVILHLITFKYGSYYLVEYDGVEIRDLFRLVAEVFQNPFIVFWYVICLIILAFHLGHGLEASFRSLGFYSPWMKKISFVYAFIVGAGFISQPLYFLFFYPGGIVGS